MGSGPYNLLAVAGVGMTPANHAPGEIIEWSLVPERAYALPPGAEDEALAKD